MKQFVRLASLLCVMCLGAFGAKAQAPTANFNATPDNGCAPVSVQFTNLSSGNIDSLRWTFTSDASGQVITTTVQNPSYTFTTVDNIIVKLVVYGPGGSSTKLDTLIIGSTPAIDFTISDTTSQCAPKTVSFSPIVTANASGDVTYLWDFGDTSTSTLMNPTHTYLEGTQGPINITLTVTNSAGCSATLTKFNVFTLNTPPFVNFTSTNNQQCNFPAAVTFTHLPVSGVTYTWVFGDGDSVTTTNQTSVTHTYGPPDAPGPFTVTLKANQNGCKNQITKPDYVFAGRLVAGFDPSNDSVCIGGTVAFTNTTYDQTQELPAYAWYYNNEATPFSQDANPTYTFTTAGLFPIKLVVNSGSCSDSIVKNVRVLALPVPFITADDNYNCTAPFTVNFTYGSIPNVSSTTYQINFNATTNTPTTGPGLSAGTVSHTYTTASNTTPEVIATTAFGCQDSTTGAPIVIAPPNAVITSSVPDSGCAPITACYTATSPNGGAIQSYSWSVSPSIPGGTSTAANPCFTFPGPAPAVYTLTLNYDLGGGCTGTVTRTIKLGTPPNAAFTTSPNTNPLCTNIPVTFTNTSTGLAPGYTTRWYYQDPGTPSPLTGPTNTLAVGTFTYQTPGTYNQALVVGNSGCYSTVTQPITIIGANVAFTNALTNCSNRKAYTFTSTTTGITGGANYSWEFLQGTTSLGTATGPTANFTFPSYDVVYTVTLTVEDIADGCTTVKSISVTPRTLSSAFTVLTTDTCVNSPVCVQANTNLGVFTYIYNWGDNTPVTTLTNAANGNTCHSYTTPGNYTIKLKVVDAQGCADSTTSTVVHIIGPNVTISANDSTLCAGQSVTLTGSATSLGGAIDSSHFVINGVTYPTGNDPQSLTITPPLGFTDVVYYVTDALGCTGVANYNDFISVLPNPVASFYANDTGVCPGTAVTFISTASSALVHTWTFEQGNPPTVTGTTTPTATWTQTGDFDVSLTVTNANGCSGTTTIADYITVFDVQASFTMSDDSASCPPFEVCFTNTSSNANQYYWTFGTIGAASTPNPCFTFTTAGVFPITLTAISSQGCSDTTTDTVYVGGPTGTFTYSPLDPCIGENVTFEVQNTNATTFIWDPRDFTNATTGQPSYVHQYTATGSYVPLVILSDGQSCSYPLVGTDTIRVDKQNAAITALNDSVCIGNPINFSSQSTPALNPIATSTFYFEWPATSPSATGSTASYTYPTPGVHTVVIVVATANGCSDTDTVVVYVRPNPNVTINPQAPEVCLGQSVILTVNGGGPNALYNWADPTMTLSDSTSPTPEATPTTTTTYSVVVTNQFGCVGSASRTVVVNPLPVLTISGDSAICQEQCTDLTVNGNPTITSVLWTGPSINNPTALSVVVCPVSTAVYEVTGTTAKGCQSTTTRTVTVTPVPDFVVPNPGAICAGDTVLLAAVGAPDIQFIWNPSNLVFPDLGDTVRSAPATTSTLTVIGVRGECADTQTVTIVVNQLPIVSAGPDVTICEGDTATLTATGANEYFWTPQPVECATCAQTDVYPTDTTQYEVLGIDIHNCVNRDSVIVNVVQRVVTSLNDDAVDICRGDSILLVATGGQSYTWTPTSYLSNPNNDSTYAFPDQTTTYTVVIRQNQCFVDTYSVVVSVRPVPQIDLGPDFVLYAGDKVQLNSNPRDANTFAWTPQYALTCYDCPYPEANPLQTTTYILTAGNEFGCTAMDTLTITVRCDSLIFFPNTFTPNGDYQNDVFYPRARGTVKIDRFRIYNRWGEMVFEAQNVIADEMQYGWDGTYRGVPAKPDVYIYTADFKCLDGTQSTMKGDITLLR